MKNKDVLLNKNEYTVYMKDISTITKDLIKSILTIADRYNVDRDSAMQHFSKILSTMVDISTFRNFKL